MRVTNRLAGIVTLFASITFLVAGCGKESDKGNQTETKDGQAEKKSAKDGEEKQAHDHSGWWCEEHGVPENLCSVCSNEAAAKCKKGIGANCTTGPSPSASSASPGSMKNTRPCIGPSTTRSRPGPRKPSSRNRSRHQWTGAFRPWPLASPIGSQLSLSMCGLSVCTVC
jgi:hypothetical protein